MIDNDKEKLHAMQKVSFEEESNELEFSPHISILV